jgi:hypothetical protein
MHGIHVKTDLVEEGYFVMSHRLAQADGESSSKSGRIKLRPETKGVSGLVNQIDYEFQ